MDTIRTIGCVMGSIKMLLDLIAKNRELAVGVAAGLRSMNRDFDLIRRVPLEGEQKQQQLTAAMQLRLQELAYDIDDFIQGLWVPGEPGSFILSAVGVDSRPQIIDRVKDFKESIKNLKEELSRSFEAIPAGPSSSAGSPVPYAPAVDLVGIEGPKQDIVELLAPRVEPHLGKLSVISILGCSGSGKTALARALYQDEDVVNKFSYKAWVVASDHPSSADIVNKICQALVSTSAATGSTPQAFHSDKRYLVFVDDVLPGTKWKDITNAFRENFMDSRIILTTRVPSVARDCSSGSYEYTMQGLDQENSSELFCRKFWGKTVYSEEDKYRLGIKDVDFIVNKCDGLPIALISAAECLRMKGLNPVKDDFIQVSQELCDRLACSDSDFEKFQKQSGIETTFAEMRRARVEPYKNQLNNGEKECLLYVSIFPCRHEINSKSLIRRLIAEGLVPGDPEIVKASELVVGDVRECVRKLMDQHMIEPVPIRNYSNVAKRCRVHSIMLQFTIKEAVSRNLVSLIHNDQPLRSATGLVRRLTVQSSPLIRGNKCPEGMDLSVLRSLSIFKSRILDFEKCKLVRVLDLEGCRGLTTKDLHNICGLLFLKYFSLKNTGIPELPENVKKLMFLETLDIRDNRDTQDTVVIKLPAEVLMLPRFAYLFGKFELTNLHSDNRKKLTKFFSEQKSQLHTLGGIAVHETKGLEIVLLVIQNATKLKKVKVWYKDTSSSTCPVTTSTPVASGTPGLPCAGPLADSSGNAQDPAPTTSTPVPGDTPGLPCAGPLADSSGNAQDPAPTTSTPVSGGTAGLPSTGPSADSSSNAQDPTPATSTAVADGTPEPIPGATELGLSTLLKPKWKRFLPQLFRRRKKPIGSLSKRKLSAEPAANPTSNTHDSALEISTPVPGGTPALPCVGPLADSNNIAQDSAPMTSTPVPRGTPALPCVGPLADSNNIAQDSVPMTSTPVSGGTPALPCVGPLADSNNIAQDSSPMTSTPVPTGTTGPPSARPSADSRSNTPDPALATSTPLASNTPVLIHCVSRLTETLKKHPITLESLSIDFNGVSNTFLDFLQINGTISSIKLMQAQKSLPGPLELGKVSNLKKLHLFSTGLKSGELGALQHLKCLQYLKLAEEGHGLWDSEFHVEVGGSVSLIWLCFQSSNSKHPDLKIDEGVKTPLNSLLLLCKESHPRVEGISHLANLHEVILHPSATDDEVSAWKGEAKRHINRPYVERQQV